MTKEVSQVHSENHHQPQTQTPQQHQCLHLPWLTNEPRRKECNLHPFQISYVNINWKVGSRTGKSYTGNCLHACHNISSAENCRRALRYPIPQTQTLRIWEGIRNDESQKLLYVFGVSKSVSEYIASRRYKFQGCVTFTWRLEKSGRATNTTARLKCASHYNVDYAPGLKREHYIYTYKDTYYFFAACPSRNLNAKIRACHCEPCGLHLSSPPALDLSNRWNWIQTPHALNQGARQCLEKNMQFAQIRCFCVELCWTSTLSLYLKKELHVPNEVLLLSFDSLISSYISLPLSLFISSHSHELLSSLKSRPVVKGVASRRKQTSSFTISYMILYAVVAVNWKGWWKINSLAWPWHRERVGKCSRMQVFSWPQAKTNKNQQEQGPKLDKQTARNRQPTSPTCSETILTANILSHSESFHVSRITMATRIH